ncbi:hypothetical protein GWA97_10495 [Flavobacterium sp. LaA7.5]|nr:hypothetical protein [Flavobacterium salilacus subsp. altitudinum]
MKIKLFAFAIVAMLFASCSDDDVEVVVDTENLTQKWYNSYYIVNGETIGHENETCNNVIKYDYIEFITGEAQDIYKTVESVNCTFITTEGSYTLNGRQLTVTLGDVTETFTIKELTEDKLDIESQYDFDGDGEEDNVREVYAKNP